MAFGPKNKEVFDPKEVDEKRGAVSEGRAEGATAAVESGTLREAFGILNESGEAAEDGVEAMGNVSEQSSEGRERKSDSAQTSKKRDDSAKAQSIRQQIINSKPTQRQMLNDIHKHFKKEQKVLHKKMMKCANAEDWHEYNGAMSRLRQIRDTLSNLVHATYDVLKNAWLKVVHGIV